MTLSKNLIVKVAPWLADTAALGLGGISFSEFDGWEKFPIGIAISLYIAARAYQVKTKTDSDEKDRAASRKKVEEEARTIELKNNKVAAEIEQMKAFTLDHLESAVLQIVEKQKKENENK